MITAVDDTAVFSADDLVAAVREYSAGDKSALTVCRGGDYLTVTVTFGEAVPDDAS